MPNRNHKRKNTGGLSKRDRGRKTERAPLRTPREVSVERVDPNTMIVRVPDEMPDEALESIVLHVRDLARQIAGDGVDIVAGGVWLTPDEVVEMERRDGRDHYPPGGPDDLPQLGRFLT